jgi:transmembrane 9 superfamily protein 2/4
MQAQDALNLGEVLHGSRIYESPYTFQMGKQEVCKILCRAVYDKEEIQAFTLMVEEDYKVNMLLDHLPVAQPMYEESGAKTYATGYPVGFASVLKGRPGAVLLNNHIHFTVLYNDFHGPDKQRVVGFEVKPMSVLHSYDNKVDWDQCINTQSGGKCKLNTCDSKHAVDPAAVPPLALDAEARSQEVIWTYDVDFIKSQIRWSTRWDTYLHADGDADVHW